MNELQLSAAKKAGIAVLAAICFISLNQAPEVKQWKW